MSALLAGALISGALGIGKAIFGGIQASKGNREMKNLLANRPKYSIPQAYMQALGTYQNLASSEMPGQQYYENRIGESTARTMTNAERGAISSNVYQGAVESAQDKELQALQGLAKMGAEYRTSNLQNLAQAQNVMGGLQDQQFNYNVAQPYDIKLNMANEQKQAGVTNLFGGLGDVGSAAMNFLGTKHYADVMKKLMTNG